MSQNVIQQTFSNPQHEIKKLQNDLVTHFGKPIASIINTLALQYAEDTHSFICDIVLTPFVEINNLAKTFPQNASKEQYHQFLEEVFKRSNPADTVDNINTILKTRTIQQNYNEAIQQFEDSSAIQGLFKKASFQADMIRTIQQTAVSNIEYSLKALRGYIKSLNNHQKIVREVAESASSKSVLKTGASLVGIGLGIPFLGMGLGALMKSGDKAKINQSIEQLLHQLDHLSEKLTDTILDMDHAIHLMYLTLIGGTIVAVNEKLKQKHCYISGLNEYDIIQYDITKEEKTRYNRWVDTTTSALNELMVQKRYTDAIVLAKKFYGEVVKNPIHARAILPNDRTALHIAHTYYFTIFQEALLEEYRSGHVDSFVKRGNEVVSHLMMDIYDDKLPPFATDPSYFFVLLIKETLKQKQLNDVHQTAKSFIDHIILRAGARDVLNEQLVSSSNMMNAGALALLCFYFEHNVEKLTTKEQKIFASIVNSLTPERVEQLIKLDKTHKTKDAFTKYLSNRYNEARKHKRSLLFHRTFKIVLITVLVGAICFGVYKYANPAREKVVEWWDKGVTFISKDEQNEDALVVEEPVNEPQEEVSETSEAGFFASLKDKAMDLWHNVTGWFSGDEEQITQPSTTVTVNVESASIRNVPNYNASEVIGYAEMNEQLELQKAAIQDEGGTDITWLQVTLRDGTTGYISSRIVTINSEEIIE